MEIILSFWNVLVMMAPWLLVGFLLGEVARPLAVGLVVAAVVTAFVPANFFATAFGGNDWLAMPAMVLLKLCHTKKKDNGSMSWMIL